MKVKIVIEYKTLDEVKADLKKLEEFKMLYSGLEIEVEFKQP